MYYSQGGELIRSLVNISFLHFIIILNSTVITFSSVSHCMHSVWATMICEICWAELTEGYKLHNVQFKHVFCENCALADLLNRFTIILKDNEQLFRELSEERKLLRNITTYFRDWFQLTHLYQFFFCQTS